MGQLPAEYRGKTALDFDKEHQIEDNKDVKGVWIGQSEGKPFPAGAIVGGTSYRPIGVIKDDNEENNSNSKEWFV